MKKKIMVFVGSRANYSSCKPIMKAIQKSSLLELQVVLGNSALLDRYGNIENLVESDGFEVSAKFYMLVEGENPVTMAKSAGLGIIELSQIFDNLKPDLVLVVGDRFDVMSPVIAASFMNIPIVHTMGGEVSGTIDESIRHAVTKLAHLHFPANEDARERIIKMGENPEMVFNVGCPRIDLVKEVIDGHRAGQKLNPEELFAKYKGVGRFIDVNKEPFILVSQHPVTTEYGSNRKHIEATLTALNKLSLPVIMLWPNADAGTDEISKGIRTFREKYKPEWLHLFINLPTDIYIKLMDLCSCLVGNSSSAIREGAFIGTPAINIGTRQVGRVRGHNVIDVAPDAKDIEEAVRVQITNKKFKSDYVYGRGDASNRIADIVSEKISRIAVQKRIHY